MKRFLETWADETKSIEVRELILSGLDYHLTAEGTPATSDPSAWPRWIIATGRATAADGFTRNHHNQIAASESDATTDRDATPLKLNEVTAFGAMVHFVSRYQSPPGEEDISQQNWEIDFNGFDATGRPGTSDPGSWSAWLDAVRSITER